MIAIKKRRGTTKNCEAVRAGTFKTLKRRRGGKKGIFPMEGRKPVRAAITSPEGGK